MSMRMPLSFSIALASALTIGACTAKPADSHAYQLHGQVLAITADHKEATIKHEEIKGFMPGMTMPYKVRDAKEYEKLAPGDVIDGTLIVESNDAYLKDVKKVGQAPLEKAP